MSWFNDYTDISGVTPKEYDFSGFSKNKTSYNVTVPKNVDSLRVFATAADSNAKVKITGNSGFEVGTNNKITKQEIVEFIQRGQNYLYVYEQDEGIVGATFFGAQDIEEYDYDSEVFGLYTKNTKDKDMIHAELLFDTKKELFNMGYRKLVIWADETDENTTNIEENVNPEKYYNKSTKEIKMYIKHKQVILMEFPVPEEFLIELNRLGYIEYVSPKAENR